MEKVMSKTPMHNSEAMRNDVRELPNQANELTTDELEQVSGGFNYDMKTGVANITKKAISNVVGCASA
jgi:bacteriocin-like protein